MNLDTIWERFEDFCKLQSNEVRAQFDLSTSFCQGNKSIDEWYNAVQAQVNLAKYSPKTAKILHWDIFWFFLCDEDFVSRTVTEGRIDLDKFPTSRVRQLVKKFESCKPTVHHIKQIAGDLPAAQINLMWHQRTKLQTNRHNKKRRPISKQRHYKAPENQVTGQVKKHYGSKIVHKNKDWCNKCSDSIHAQGFQCPAKKYQCKVCHKYGHFFQVSVTKRRIKLTTKTAEETQRCINWMQAQCMWKTVHFAVILKNQVLMSPFACSCKYNEIKLRVRRFPTLFTL